MIDMVIPNKGFTHAGVFHADDVFATALLKIINPNFTWVRGNVAPENFDGIVYDIGGGEFDHHQVGSRVRDNGVPYAAFGLIWEKYGVLVMPEKEANRFDKEFVQMIDNTDNTGVKNPVSSIIHDMNPEWDEDISFDDAFQNAVGYAIKTLECQFKHISSKKHSESIVKSKIADAVDGCLYLGDYLPWRDALRDTDINYVIYNSNRGGYNIQTVPHTDNNISEKCFPIEWRGKAGAELEEVSGIRGITFCHHGGFLCAVNSLKAAWDVVLYCNRGNQCE